MVVTGSLHYIVFEHFSAADNEQSPSKVLAYCFARRTCRPHSTCPDCLLINRWNLAGRTRVDPWNSCRASRRDLLEGRLPSCQHSKNSDADAGLTARSAVSAAG